MSDDLGPKRPFGVTVVAVLVWVGGVLDLIASILLLFVSLDEESAGAVGGTGMVVTMAWLSMLLGVAAIVIGFGLFRGNPVARIAATVIEIGSVLVSVGLAISQPSTLPNEILSALVAVAILVLLWSGEASRYFHGLAADQPDAS